MNNKQLTIKIPFALTALLFIAYCLLFIGARSAHASSVYLETSRSEFFVGDTILVDVKVSSGDKEINTVEGNIYLDYLSEAVSIKDISLSESALSLWPSKPVLRDDLKTISFVGGSPGGLQEQDATLFRIALNLKGAGQITLNPVGIVVYLNDGKGTRDAANTQSLAINVLPSEVGYEPINDLNILVSGDKTPPKSFKIIAGQDDSVFEGKKFLSFNTTDAESGVKYYEVREGDLSPVRSGGTYVLQNQDERVQVTVVAYDTAGNARESVYKPGRSYPSIILTAVLVLIVLSVLYRLIIKRRRNAITKS